jgi:YHS domain-containing protein
MWRALRFCAAAAVSLAAVCPIASAHDRMPWQPNLEAAQRVAAETNRLVLIHFWAAWCRPCIRLEQEVFSNPETAKGLEANFVMVKLNADEAPGTARMYGVSSLPSDVITTASGRLVSQMQSPPTSAQYVAQMNQAAAGHRSLARKPDPQAAQQSAPPTLPGSVPPANSGASYAPPYPGAANSAAPTQGDYYPSAPAPPANGTDRYAEYFPEQPSSPPQTNQQTAQVTPAQAYAPQTAPGATANPVDPYATPAAAAPPIAPSTTVAPGVDPYAAAPTIQPPQSPTQQPPHGQEPPSAAQQPYSAQASYQPTANVPQLPPGCPPMGLDGNCPVTLVERKRWTLGHPAFGVVHRGRTYLFLGPQEKEKFLADPDRYSPVLSGLDPVLALDNQVSVAGKREFGVFGADGRVYLFADEASRARFEANERSYATRALQATQPQYQAMRPNP